MEAMPHVDILFGNESVCYFTHFQILILINLDSTLLDYFLGLVQL